MADNSNMNKKGFAGLSDLASEIQKLDDPIKYDTPLSKPEQQRQRQRETDTSNPERKTTNPLLAGKDPGGSNAIFLCLLACFGIITLLIIVSSSQQESKNYSPSSTPSSSQNSYPRSHPAPATPSPSTAQSSTQGVSLQYTKPSIGTNNVLSSSEIRWCLREEIRLETMRSVNDTNAKIDAFNRLVNDYNMRCGSYRYRQGTLERAKREVETYRSQIVATAINETRNLSEKPNRQYVREAQQLLTDLGYKPGSIDGDYGRRTADAVKAFQRDTGITQDGLIDEGLLNRLRRVKAEYKL